MSFTEIDLFNMSAIVSITSIIYVNRLGYTEVLVLLVFISIHTGVVWPRALVQAELWLLDGPTSSLLLSQHFRHGCITMCIVMHLLCLLLGDTRMLPCSSLRYKFLYY